jgi:hypothetical protein
MRWVKKVFWILLLVIFYSGNIFCQVNDDEIKGVNSYETEDVKTLWVKAQAAIENDNADLATDLLKHIVNNVPNGHPLFAQSYIYLANIYGNEGNIVEMEKAIKALETYPDYQGEIKAELENIKNFYTVVKKSTASFEDDLCGIWVSDFSTDKKQGLPYIALKISKDYQNQYSVTILPYCTLAKDYGMYKGKPFDYQKEKANRFSFVASTEMVTIDKNQNRAFFYFGDKVVKKKGNESVAIAGISATEQVGDAAKDAILSDPNTTATTAVAQAVSVELSKAMIQSALKSVAASKIKVTTIDMDLQRLFPGCAKLYFIRNIHREYTDGRKSSFNFENAMMIYKLYPDYGVQFVSDGYELFGYKEYNKEEIVNNKEYKELFADKSAGSSAKQLKFNNQAYRNLSENVIKSCKYTFSDGKNNDLSKMIQERFEYATQGLTYMDIVFYKKRPFLKLTFPDDGVDLYSKASKLFEFQPKQDFCQGIYRGWVAATTFGTTDGEIYEVTYDDKKPELVSKAKQNGYGRMIWNSHRKYKEYTGEWKNENFSGEGKLEYINGDVVFGIWEKGKLVEER